MSKSILVIDAPRACIDCPCHFAKDTGKIWCGKENKDLLADDIEAFKPDWCPLWDFPQKRDLEDIEKYTGLGADYVWSEGYNACIDEILAKEFRR